MKTNAECTLGALAAAASTLVLMAACGGGSVDIDGAVDGIAGTGCSSDGTHTVVVGRFTQAVPAYGKTNLLILMSNCRWCADAIPDGGSRALTSEGTWSSERSHDGGTGIRVDKTNSQFLNIVSTDGQTVSSYRVSDGSFAGFQYTRENGSSYTCDGQ